jgi:hypothetical protein
MSPHPATLPPEQLLKECDVARTRRSGPGGQHRNKVETAIVLVHRPTGVRAEASERRSQAQNHDAAVFRLRVHLAVQVRDEMPNEFSPSLRWKSRCRGGKVVVNSSHDDFPALLAEALDVVTAHQMEIKPAAESLGCTTSQLIKLLHAEPQAMLVVNRERQARGLPKLR